jgi:colanic acid/amylovoran biosynthesis glycosyltransferase
MRVSYFTSTYPRATDTFIQREVVGLRNEGIEVLTAALRSPEATNNVSDLIRNERKNTAYFLPANPLRLLKINILTVVKAPGDYLKTLKLAFKTRKPGIKGALYQLFYFQEALMLSDYLKSHNIQHLHNHFGDSSGMVAMLASHLSGVGYSITFHGPHIFFEPTLLALREKIKYAKFIVCISHYCKSQLMLFSDVEDWHKLKIVHCGVDVDQYAMPLVKPINDLSQPVKLLYVGRLAAEKGVPVLLRSLISLKNDGHRFHLTLLGDGPERTALEMEVKENGLTEMVHFAGFASQETVRDTLQNSDVFILPSFAEGVPVSLMEAMACGVPVIGTNVGGVTELIEHGVSGMVVAPSDDVALQNAILSYIKHPELRETIRITARNTIESNFNFRIEVNKLEHLIKEQLQS